jgi:hypothetical protein
MRSDKQFNSLPTNDDLEFSSDVISPAIDSPALKKKWDYKNYIISKSVNAKHYFLSLNRKIQILISLLLLALVILPFLPLFSKPPPEEKPLQFYWSPYKDEVKVVQKIFYDHISNIDTTQENNIGSMLIGVSIGPMQFQRRHLMRVHQIRPYKDIKVTFRFVMGSPDPIIWDDIRYENETYGDIIVLNNFTDSRELARKIKPFEFFKYVEENLGYYTYVAKLDSDCYLNMPGLWDNLFNTTVQELDFGLIALFIQKIGVFDWPQGGFEALSWKTMLMINRFYSYASRSTPDEDTQIAWYLYDSKINYTQIEINSTQAYDFRAGSTFSWNCDVYYEAIRVHELKTNQDYINVASCFTPNGVNTSHIDYMREYNWTLNGDM